ncbi:MAG: putative transposase [Cellvibrionaceae bacterium]
MNKLEGRSGSLREGRYKASPIQRDTYLLSCLRYVELNPVKAGMVIKPESYPWSSCATRLNIDKNSELDLDECYLALSSSEYKRKVIYKEFLSQGIPEKEQQSSASSFTLTISI